MTESRVINPNLYNKLSLIYLEQFSIFQIVEWEGT